MSLYAVLILPAAAQTSKVTHGVEGLTAQPQSRPMQ